MSGWVWQKSMQAAGRGQDQEVKPGNSVGTCLLGMRGEFAAVAAAAASVTAADAVSGWDDLT